MELDAVGLVCSHEGEDWDRLAARLAQHGATPDAHDRPRSAASQLRRPVGRRQVAADVECLVGQLLAEVDRLLERFDPSITPETQQRRSRTDVERASLLAHASGALVERRDAPTPEQA